MNFPAIHLLRATALLLACAAGVSAWANTARAAFVIAPVVEGLFACGQAGAGTSETVSSNSYCTSAGQHAPRALAKLLDDLEAGGPRGGVQVGYVLTVQLLGLYRRQGAEWVLDEGKLQRILELVREVERPVVLYLASNHFDSQGELAASLLDDQRNLLQLADGTAPTVNYFGYRVVPYTLLTDEAIPVNRYRFAALRQIASKLAALPAPLRDRVLAVALGGEIHHMFPNFDGGMGVHDRPKVTDYSPASLTAFRSWLQRKYGSIDRLNAAAGAAYQAFEEVRAPSRNAFLEPGVPHPEHYDGFAAGHVPVSGWLWDPHEQVQGLELLVDGRFVAEIERGFNRLDVYRGVEAIQDPNIGFRHDLDVSSWRPGSYQLQVIARSARGRHEIARRRLVIEGKGARNSRLVALWERASSRVRFLIQRGMHPLPGIRSSLDYPRNNEQVLYNPLARDWNEFRTQQVRGFMDRLYRIALDSGLPAEKLYSHQILARVNSSWNPDLFATDGSVGAALPWKQGFNTYGGAAGGEWVRQFVQEGRLSDYAIPEFHPQQWKRPAVHLEALRLHQKLGARFVSPYYVSIVSDRGQQAQAAVKAMEIRPNNKLEGSDMLFRAIREMAAQ